MTAFAFGAEAHRRARRDYDAHLDAELARVAERLKAERRDELADIEARAKQKSRTCNHCKMQGYMSAAGDSCAYCGRGSDQQTAGRLVEQRSVRDQDPTTAWPPESSKPPEYRGLPIEQAGCGSVISVRW